MTFDEPYQCSLSPALRVMLQTMPHTKAKLQAVAVRMLSLTAGDPEVRATLQVPTPLPGFSPARQCDLKDDNGTVVFKSWVMWKETFWLVCLEGGQDTYWEEQHHLPVASGGPDNIHREQGPPDPS